MVSLVDNAPRNLSIRIDNLWITPAYQSKLYAHETMLITLQSLFGQSKYKAYHFYMA
jgi:hypothetical protein